MWEGGAAPLFHGCHSPLGAPAGAGPDDFRTAIHPKHPDAVLSSLGLDRPYYQVFSDRFGFTPDLSVLDLLFNEGPDSVLWLKKQDHFADKGI